MVKISDKGFLDPLPDPGLFSEASAIALGEVVRNMENEPPAPSPLISSAVIGVLLGTSHIFMLTPQFQSTFGEPLLAKVATTTIQVFNPINPTFIIQRPYSTAPHALTQTFCHGSKGPWLEIGRAHV